MLTVYAKRIFNLEYFMISVFDLDGTVADASNRLHYIKGKRRDWNKFFEEIPHDPPFNSMIELVRTFARDPLSTVIFQTGRPEKYRQLTIDWLRTHGIIPEMFGALLMRPDNDHSRNVDIKMGFVEYILDRYPDQEILWFEDSPAVVQMVNKQGILALSAEHFHQAHQFELDTYEIPGGDEK